MTRHLHETTLTVALPADTPDASPSGTSLVVFVGAYSDRAAVRDHETGSPFNRRLVCVPGDLLRAAANPAFRGADLDTWLEEATRAHAAQFVHLVAKDAAIPFGINWVLRRPLSFASLSLIDGHRWGTGGAGRLRTSLHRWERKPNDGRFVVVSDIYPTPTTDQADLILPSAAWVEREGMFGNSERRTQHWDKLVDPPGEAKEDAWQIVEVARRMGMGHLFPYATEEHGDWHKPMFEEYRRFTLGHGKDLASYDQLREARGLRWPVVDGKETRYRYAAGHDPYVKKRKGVHFYKAKKNGEKAAFWLRPYHPPAEMPDDEYPMWLSTGRVLEHWHTGSMTRRVPQLHQAVPEAYVEVNRADAQEQGWKSGDKVRLVSRRGELELPVAVDGRGKPPRGSVFVPFFDEHRLVNRLTLDAMDSISKEPDYKKCAVRLERV